MLKLLRISILTISTLAFWAAWYGMPELLTPESVKWLSAIFTVLWGLELLFFRRLNEVSNVSGLSTREHERLVIRLEKIRRRIWWIGCIGMASALLNWFLAALGLPSSSAAYAAMAGALFGISLSYLVLIPFWFSETQQFIDAARLQAETQKRRDEAVKNITG